MFLETYAQTYTIFSFLREDTQSESKSVEQVSLEFKEKIWQSRL